MRYIENPANKKRAVRKLVQKILTVLEVNAGEIIERGRPRDDWSELNLLFCLLESLSMLLEGDTKKRSYDENDFLREVYDSLGHLVLKHTYKIDGLNFPSKLTDTVSWCTTSTKGMTNAASPLEEQRYIYDLKKYGVKRTNKMYAILKSWTGSWIAYSLLEKISQFAFDLYLDITVKDFLLIKHNKISLRLNDEVHLGSSGHKLVQIYPAYWCEGSGNHSLRDIQHLVVGLLAMNEEWSNRTLSLAKIVTNYFTVKGIKSIYVGRGELHFNFPE